MHVPQRLRHALSSALLVFALALGAIACGPHYQVISSSGPPSAVAGLNPIAVQYDYSHIAISNKRLSEADWLATREQEEHRKTYLETKTSANTGILEGLQKALPGKQIAEGQAPAGGIQVTVTYTYWEEGVFAGVVAWPSQITARVIFSRDGQTLDEIEVTTKENASIYTPAPQQRLHTCGQRLGQFTAEYIAAAG